MKYGFGTEVTNSQEVLRVNSQLVLTGLFTTEVVFQSDDDDTKTNLWQRKQRGTITS